MQTIQRIALILCALGLATTASGCLLAGNYHSAKTLGKGESAFGVTFSATQYKFNDGAGGVDSVLLPNLIPEITYHIGMSDDLEVGGRVGLGQLAMEGDLKYRFYKSDKLHLAIAPAIGFQSLVVISGTMLRLPAVATYELSDNFAVMGAVFANTTRYGAVDPNDNSDFGAFSGALASTGGSIGVELSGETFIIRPAVEFSRYVASFDNDNFEPFNTMNVMVHLAFIGGREKKQLDRIENKLDQMRGVQ